MSVSVREVETRYPLHWLIWNNRHEELGTALKADNFSEEQLEVKDPRGRTPLLLAVTLGHIESVKLLIEAGANVNCEKDGWTAVQEATATGDPELLALVLVNRNFRRQQLHSQQIPDVLNRLSLAPDFYVEMKWEFTSWVPLVSRMCPFDTYKVYKRGANVRVDTTLVSFDQNKWQRGKHTYIFKGQGRNARLTEVDHDSGTQWSMHLEADSTRPASPVSTRQVKQRLAQPIAINYLDTDKICFERNKSGVWGWRQDKTEPVNGYECKVFSANNVELVSKTRAEHLPRGHRSRLSSPKVPLAGLLSLAEDDTSSVATEEEETLITNDEQPAQLEPVTWQEYFSDEPLGERDIGRQKEITAKVQKFKATLWLCEDYPLELQEQIMPILDLMATLSSPHFAKLKDFIHMQLPSGFPVKIEIPLFHVMNARITFGNIFGTETAVPNIECITEGARLSCVVDDACFTVPPHYRDLAQERHPSVDDEEELLQYAIQQSLMEAGTHNDQVDVWEALRGARPTTPRDNAHELADDLLSHEETQLQRAIEASLGQLSVTDNTQPVADQSPEDPYQRALRLSALEQHTRQEQMLDEQRQLDEALRLSLLDQ